MSNLTSRPDHSLQEFADGIVAVLPAASGEPQLIQARSGAYQVLVNLRPTGTEQPLGLACFGRCDQSGAVGAVAAHTPEGEFSSLAPFCRPVITLGPCYKEADASWVPLSGLDAGWCDVAVRAITPQEATLAFEVEYRVGGGPTLWETYRLSEAGLEYETRIAWVIGGFRLHLPLFVTDGKLVGVPALAGANLSLAVGKLRLRAIAADPDWRWELEPNATYANNNGTYQNAMLQGRSAIRFAVHLTIEAG